MAQNAPGKFLLQKVPLTPEVYSLLVANQLDWATIVLGPKGRGVFSAVHNLSSKAFSLAPIVPWIRESALLEEASALLENTNDYYFWAFVTRQKNYPVQGDLQHLPAGKLLQIAQDMIDGWHPNTWSA